MSTQEISTRLISNAAPDTRPSSRPVQALWATSLISFFGNQLTAVAIPWFVLETTGSPSRTGITAAVTIVPVILANFFGGAFVDRVSYRTMSIAADLSSAVTVAAVPILYLTVGLDFTTLLALMFFGALLDAPGHTARTAMVPPLSKLTGIPLERINANFGMIGAMSALFSAPLAGILIAWLGPLNVIWFNAGTFVVSSLAVLLFVPALARPAPTGETFLRDVRDGLAYVRDNAILRTVIMGALCVNFLFAPFFGVAIPWFANQELHSVRALGIMLGGEGLGALLGAYLYGRLGTRVRRRPLLLCSLTLLTLPLYPIGLVANLWTATALLVLIGFGSGMVNPMIGTFLQRTTPEQYMGRVMGLLTAGAMVAQPVGLLLGGTLVALLDFRGFAGAIALLMTLISALLWLSPALHDLDLPPPGEPPAMSEPRHG